MSKNVDYRLKLSSYIWIIQIDNSSLFTLKCYIEEPQILTLRLGNSGQGPILVSPNKAFNLRAKVTENSDFRYAFEQTVNNISIFIVEGTNETSTTQITGGKIAGLVNYYAYVQEVKSSVDDIAFRVARDFNAVQKNGKDLTGKIGNDMFLVGYQALHSLLT